MANLFGSMTEMKENVTKLSKKVDEIIDKEKTLKKEEVPITKKKTLVNLNDPTAQPRKSESDLLKWKREERPPWKY